VREDITMAERTDGTWSGMMFSAEGDRAEVSMNLKNQKGDVQITVIGDEIGETVKGRITRLDSQNNKLHLVWEIDNGKGEQEFACTFQSLKRHAEAAIYGLFSSVQSTPELPDSGVLIVWRYSGR
jgi:hypothetical protein